MLDYIHIPSIGSQSNCQVAITEIGKILYSLWRDDKIASYGNYVFHQKEDITLFLQETNYQEFTQDRLPFVLTRVKPKLDSSFNLEELMKTLNCELLIIKPAPTVPEPTATSAPQNQTQNQ